MNAVYNLVDIASGNLVGSYATESEAREIIRDTWRRFGSEGLSGLSLLRVDPDGSMTLLAEDGDLLALVPTAITAKSIHASS